ncbi:hypothetical protein Tco_0271976 [Tanacetum coccineum]
MLELNQLLGNIGAPCAEGMWMIMETVPKTPLKLGLSLRRKNSEDGDDVLLDVNENDSIEPKNDPIETKVDDWEFKGCEDDPLIYREILGIGLGVGKTSALSRDKERAWRYADGLVNLTFISSLLLAVQILSEGRQISLEPLDRPTEEKLGI